MPFPQNTALRGPDQGACSWENSREKTSAKSRPRPAMASLISSSREAGRQGGAWGFAWALGGLVLLLRRTAQASFFFPPQLSGKAGLEPWPRRWMGPLVPDAGHLGQMGQFGPDHQKLILLPTPGPVVGRFLSPSAVPAPLLSL